MIVILPPFSLHEIFKESVIKKGQKITTDINPIFYKEYESSGKKVQDTRHVVIFVLFCVTYSPRLSKTNFSHWRQYGLI